jgi:hypothetical protein
MAKVHLKKIEEAQAFLSMVFSDEFFVPVKSNDVHFNDTGGILITRVSGIEDRENEFYPGDIEEFSLHWLYRNYSDISKHALVQFRRGSIQRESISGFRSSGLPQETFEEILINNIPEYIANDIRKKIGDVLKTPVSTPDMAPR